VALDDGWMYPIDGFEADLSFAGPVLQIDRAEGTFGGDPFRLSGRLPLAALTGNPSAGPSRILLETASLSIVPVVARSESIHRLVTDGAIGGRLEAAGVGLDWKTWSGTATVERLELRMRDYLLQATETVTVPIADGRVTIPEGTRVREGRTDLTIGGHVDLSPLAVNLDVHGQVGFEPLNVLSDAWGTGGLAEVNLRVYGPAGDLAYDGTADITGAVLSTPVLRQPIEQIGAHVVFDNRRIRVEDGTGELGGGGVALAGELFLQENALRSFRLAATVDNATIRLERDVRIRASADVIHDGTPEASLLSGNVTLHEAMYRRELTADAALLEMLEAPETDPDPLLQAIGLDLRVRGSDSLFIDNNLAEVEVTADLNVRGTAARPVVLGRSVILGGQLFWNDNIFDVTQGTVEYNNPFETDPTFEIRARTEIRRYTIDLSFSGSLQRGVAFNYTSTPALSDLDLFNLLAFGEEPDSAVLQDPYSYQRALGLQATRYLTDAYLSEVEQGAARLFGIDRFRISPTVTGEETDATARLTIGKRIDRNLYVTYSRLLSNSEDQLLTVEYRLTPSIRLKGTRDEDGSFGIDVLIQRRIR
jgi:translocation and assembly module TamB